MTVPEGQTHADEELRALIGRVAALAWSALPDRSLDGFNQRFGDYTGRYRHQLYGLQWKSLVHPDDIQQLEIWCQNINQSSMLVLRKCDFVVSTVSIAGSKLRLHRSTMSWVRASSFHLCSSLHETLIWPKGPFVFRALPTKFGLSLSFSTLH
jgi:hypothetical protein